MEQSSPRLIHSYIVQQANEKTNISWRSGLCQQANENKEKSQDGQAWELFSRRLHRTLSVG